MRFAEIVGQIDRDNTKFNSSIQRVEETLYRQIADVERRLQAKINEIQHEIQASIQHCHEEIRCLETRLAENMNAMTANLENRIVSSNPYGKQIPFSIAFINHWF
ncbi:unnamed protein product [Trichobilharzia regenti]|nr:unnamed protein product [Trichobilharzia regenti]